MPYMWRNVVRFSFPQILTRKAISYLVRCHVHGSNEHNLRARLEDLIETEKKRAGKDFSRANAPMKFSDGSKLLHGAIMVMRMLGWAWRWAEWWVQFGSTWEPLLEPGQVESEMTAEELRIVESTKESRMDDARRCRLAAFGAALRNRSYDSGNGYNTEALERALRAVLHTQSLVGPLVDFEIDFFTDVLARAYRSKSKLLGFGEDKIPVANEGFCLHLEDKSPKFELGDRPLPGHSALPPGQVFEEPVSEPDDYLKYKNHENGEEVDESLFTEIDYKYRGDLQHDDDENMGTSEHDSSGESSDEELIGLSAVIDTNLLDKEKSFILKQRRGRPPKVMRLSIAVMIEGTAFRGRQKSQHRPKQPVSIDDSGHGEMNFKAEKMRKSSVHRNETKSSQHILDAELNFDKEGFRPLSSKKVDFLVTVGMKSVNEFMKTPTKDFSDQYPAWRKQQGLPPLKNETSASNTLNKWKSDVRKFYSQLIETDGSSSEVSESHLEEGKEIIPTQTETKTQRDNTQNASTTDSKKKSMRDEERESTRPSKRSRIERESDSDSKAQIKNESETHDHHQLDLTPERQKTTLSAETSKDTVESLGTPSRPRRSNVYREGLFKEIDDDDPIETDTEIEIVNPRKRKPGRPRKSETTSKNYSEVDDDLNAINSEKDAASKPTGPKPKKRKPGGPRKRGRPPKNKPKDLLQALPEEGLEFLKTVGVTSARKLLSSTTSELAAPYIEFRKETGQPVLKGTGAASKVSSWKRIVRDTAIAVNDTEMADLGLRIRAEKKNISHETETDDDDDDIESDDDDRCAICDEGGELLICDNCEKSYHLHCVELEEVPDGEWFCPDCAVKDDDICAVCKKEGFLMVCDGCEAAYHPKCVGLSDVPEDDWFCPECAESRIS
jgi:hypothetical protein